MSTLNMNNSDTAVLSTSFRQQDGTISLPDLTGILSGAPVSSCTVPPARQTGSILQSRPWQRDACRPGVLPFAWPPVLSNRRPGVFSVHQLLRSRQIPAFIAMHREKPAPKTVRAWFSLLDCHNVLAPEERSYAAAQLIASFQAGPEEPAHPRN